MEKIKVLHVFDNLNVGGAETLVFNLHKFMEKNYEFDYIVHSKKTGIYEADILKRGGKIFRFNKFKIFNIIPYIYQWKRFLKLYGKNYDIVHGHLRVTANIYSKLCIKNNIKTIIHSHSTSTGKGIKGFFRKILITPLKHTKAYRVTCSVESAKWLFGSSKDVFVLKNGIDYDKFKYNSITNDYYRNFFGISKNDIVIGHVGRFDDAKNQIYLIEIFKQMPKNYKLLLIGDGINRQKLEKIVKDNNKDTQIIFGGIHKNVSDIMSCFNIFAFPSKYEGLPLTLIEAQAASLNCLISSNITEEAIIAHKLVSKLEIGSSNIEKWRKKLIEGFAEIDRSIIEEIDHSFDLIKVVNSLEEYYRRILNE